MLAEATGIAKLCLDVVNAVRGVMRDRGAEVFVPSRLLQVHQSLAQLRDATARLRRTWEVRQEKLSSDDLDQFQEQLEDLFYKVTALNLDAIQIYSPVFAHKLANSFAVDSVLVCGMWNQEWHAQWNAKNMQARPFAKEIAPEALIELCTRLQNSEYSFESSNSRRESVEKLGVHLEELKANLEQSMAALADFMKATWTPKDLAKR
jgi:hypothetical protein